MTTLFSTPITPELVRGCPKTEPTSDGVPPHPRRLPRPDATYDLVIDRRPTASGTITGGKSVVIDMHHPGLGNGALPLRTIRSELARIVEEPSRADVHPHHLSGLRLHDSADAAQLPLPDRLHPDAATSRLVGERFATLGLAPHVTSPGRRP